MTPYWSQNDGQFNEIYSKISKEVFTVEKPYGAINFGDKGGTSGYYSRNVTSHDAEKVKTITDSKGIMSENTRLVKINDHEFVLKVASVDEKETVIEQDGTKITLKYG